MSKDSVHSIGHVGHLFPKKYCIACKKSMLKVQINLSFVTSFEDSHTICNSNTCMFTNFPVVLLFKTPYVNCNS